MTIAYENSEKFPPNQIVYENDGKVPPMQYGNPNQPTYMATAPPNPPQTTYIQVVNTSMPQRNGWQNRRSNTIISGMFIFMYGGMDLAQGLGWNFNSGIPTTTEFQYSWFVGVIIGAVLSAFSVTHVPKLYLYSLAMLLELIDAIIFASGPTNYTAILAARYLGGIGIGLMTVAFIIHNSEITTSRNRGIFSGMEQYGLALGIALQVIFVEEWGNMTTGLNLTHGICGIVLCLIALGCVAFSAESPIFYLRQNNEAMARTCQLRHINILASTTKFNKIFDEAKSYVAEGSSMSIGSELASSVMPFIKMIFCRCLVAFTFSVPLSNSFIVSTVVSVGYQDWTIIVWCVLRWIGAIISLILLDKLGRKIISVMGLLCMAVLMLVMAGIFSSSLNLISVYYMTQVNRISVAFQFFAGIYVTCTSAYLGEAFPMRVKPFLIGLIICLEQVIHIIVIFNDTVYYYLLVVGIILVISLLIFVILMPETRGLTLRQAGHRFRRVQDVKAY